MLDLLVVSPHPDDAELGMGGTLARAHAEGRSTGIVDLTRGEAATKGTPEERAARARGDQRTHEQLADEARETERAQRVAREQAARELTTTGRTTA